MASRLKRLVHRSREKAVSDEHPLAGGEAALPTSAYDNAAQGDEPTAGCYPIRGKTSSTSDRGESRDRRRSRSRPRRFSLKGSKRSSREIDPTIIPVRDTSNSFPVHSGQVASTQSNKNFDNNQEKTSWHASQSRVEQPPLDGHASRHQTSSRRLSGNRNSAEAAAISQARFSRRPLHSNAQYPSDRASTAGQEASAHSPVRSALNRNNVDQPTKFSSSHSKPPVPPKDHPSASPSHNTGQAIVERAQTDSEDVELSEHIAPAVTHEIVHNEIHHLHEEQITREIHEHDVYHRTLPIIDVEVLPARHFLPSETGGLVEVNAEDVPGRKKNWVIAETVSQIPSNQPAQTKRRQFTAREFTGSEGASRRYITPEGYEKTEQTWVHPPTLETGARDTGQSWPLEIGDLSLDERVDTKQRTSKSPTHTVKRKAVDGSIPIR